MMAGKAYIYSYTYEREGKRRRFNEIMAKQNEDLEDISFDADWEYCSLQQTSTNSSIIPPLIPSNSLDSSQWLPVSLPHLIDEDLKINNSLNWWYRKKFNWILSDQISEEGVIHLVFQSNSSSITASVWLNEKEISSNSILSQLKPIELPCSLIQRKQTNSLIIACENQTLSLHARLIIPKNAILTSAKDINCTVHLNDADGRINIKFQNLKEQFSTDLPSLSNKNSFDEKSLEDEPVPRLTIVILIVGTRGDVQPFIALGQELLSYGHRVRLATHESFRSFVHENGLEFYPIAGDPSELMTFVVKNDGIIPSLSSIAAGDVSKHRQILSDILKSTWLACTANDDETHLPFTAEAIIANPPSFGHIHCAEKLQIPLHIMFTMPWSPTTQFGHPLCNIDYSKDSREKLNLYSYHLIEILTWSGMHRIINQFRKNTLGLLPLHTYQTTNLLDLHQVPHTYCWSTSIVPKPSDWPSHINVSGYFFLNLLNNYMDPPKDLIEFIQNNDNSSLIYIGFGSITGHDRVHLLQIVLEALEKTGYKALLSNLADPSDHLPPSVFKIGNVPHDWIFQYVSAVCHHGGAGTTAAGLRAGKPTIIVPFFGDQFFWGTIVEKIGVGPHTTPAKSITAEELAEAFRFAHQPSVRTAAQNIRLQIENENGCRAAVKAFHAHLPIHRLRSDLERTYAACYRIDAFNIQVSRPVSHVLVSANRIDLTQLKSHYSQVWKLDHEHSFHDIKRKKHLSNLIHTNNIKIRRLRSNTSSNLSPSEQNDDVSSFDDLHDESKSTKRPLWQNKISDMIKVLHRSRAADHQDHLLINHTAQALINSSNFAIKSTVESFPSTTYLGRPNIKMIEQTISNSNSPITSDPQHDQDNENISTDIQIASVVSGLPIEVCQQILLQFDQIQIKQKETPKSSRASKLLFHRQRSHSTSAVD